MSRQENVTVRERDCYVADPSVAVAMRKRRRRFVGIVSAALGVFAMLAAYSAIRSPLVEPAVAGGLFCENPVWELGTVDGQSDDAMTHYFTLENRSEAPIRLASVRTTCGCLLVEKPEETIEPHEMTAIQVRLSLPSKSGPLFQQIAVLQVDESTPLLLRIEGETVVNRRLVISPETLNFGSLQSGEKKARTVYVRTNDLSQLGVVAARCVGSGLAAAIKSRTDNQLEIEVTANAGSHAGRALEGQLVVTADGEERTLSIVGIVENKVSFVPSLFVERLSAGDHEQCSLFANRSAGAPIIEEMTFSGDQSIIVSLLDKCGSVRVERKSNDKGTRIATGTLRVRLKEGSTVEIPVAAVCVDGT